MNLFLLSLDPTECARWHCDKHVVKMILELVQMLYTAHHVNGFLDPSAPLCKSTGKPGYKKAHPNHPMTKWIRETRSNYEFTIKLAAALCMEFNHRYDHHHSCVQHVVWLSKNIPPFSKNKFTQVPQCMPDEYKVPGNSIRAYHNYYKGDKVRFARWSRRPEPPWWK